MKCNCEYCHVVEHEEESIAVWRLIVSLAMLGAGLVLNAVSATSSIFVSYSLFWYLLAYLPVGMPVMKEAVEKIREKEIFSEFTLMTIATIGAFCIGEYAEGVAVMVFYAIGESLQDKAVDRVKRNIGELIDVRPEKVVVNRNEAKEEVSPRDVAVGEVIEVKPGGRVPLDGTIENDKAFFDTSALTGESVPRTIKKGEKVLAGMISTDSVVRLVVTAPFDKSMLARILDMVQNASEKKAPAELFIRKFAHVYTPIVIGLAVLMVLVPFLVGCVSPSFVYVFHDWLYRALTFLVVSCPCALVISIPLGYFGGIGAASKKGVLFKGANYIDAITHINTVIFDKTGTLTKGVFKVSGVVAVDGDCQELIKRIAAVESQSSHPIAKAIVRHAADENISLVSVNNVSDLAGHGMKGWVAGKEILAGNIRLLDKYAIHYPEELRSIAQTLVVCAENGQYTGYVTLSDALKDDAVEAVETLKQMGIEKVVMLSGDKQQIVDLFSRQLRLDEAVGDLLPEGKVKYISALKQKAESRIIFVGDGLNDAPALAMSDVSVAMGGLGSDAAVEASDVIIQNDEPSRVSLAISVGRKTQRIIRQNVTMAIGIKVTVLLLGGLGVATLWEAVFADVGVALLAIANAMRIYKLIK